MVESFFNRNLRCDKKEDQSTVTIPDLGKIKEIFTDIRPKLTSAIHPAQHKYENDIFEESMVLKHTNEMEVSKLKASLKNKKSIGHDGISNKIPRSCSQISEKYLAGLLIERIEKQSFPDYLKFAKVILLFRKFSE